MIDQFCTNAKKAVQVIIIKIHEENMHESLSQYKQLKHDFRYL